MANIKSAKKRILVNQKKRLISKSVKSKISTYTKKFFAAVAANDIALSEKAYSEVTSVLDKAVSDNVIHANCASRRKAKFAKQLDKVKASQKSE